MTESGQERSCREEKYRVLPTRPSERHTSRKRKEVYHFIERRRRARYQARPFMGPALEAERKNIPDAWAGTLSSTGTAATGGG